jgi:hypothetical protein
VEIEMQTEAAHPNAVPLAPVERRTTNAICLAKAGRVGKLAPSKQIKHCASCNGEGKVIRLPTFVDPTDPYFYYVTGENCPDCDGTGDDPGDEFCDDSGATEHIVVPPANEELDRDAARAAAWDAARDAARAALKPTIEKLQSSSVALIHRMINLSEAVS